MPVVLEETEFFLSMEGQGKSKTNAAPVNGRWLRGSEIKPGFISLGAAHKRRQQDHVAGF